MQTEAFPQVRNSVRSLWIASCIFLTLVPLGMAIAHRSATLFVVISALLALCAAAAEGTLGRLLDDMRGKLLSLPGMAVLAFLAWALISLSWTYSFRVGSFAFGELLLAATAGFVIAMALPGRMPRWLPAFAASVVIVAAAIVFIDIKTGFYVRRLVGALAIIFIYNRTVLTLFLVMVPLLFLMSRRPERTCRVLGIVGALATVGVIFNSYSGAATIAIFVFVPVYTVARLWPKASIWLAGACFALIFSVAPFYGTMFYKVLPYRVIEVFKSNHSLERVNLWLGFEYAIREQPLSGGGFGVSPIIVRTPVIAHVPEELRTDINVGHPHNAAMQVWVELGAVGALLALIALFAMLRPLSALAPPLLAEQLAWIASITFVAIVGHGAWQGWWFAAIGAGMTWFRAERTEAAMRKSETERAAAASGPFRS